MKLMLKIRYKNVSYDKYRGNLGLKTCSLNEIYAMIVYADYN